MKTKALIYCRVSSQRQVIEGHGLDSQEQRCRSYAKNKNYEVIMVFPDEGISGSLFERPAMQRLIKFLDDNPIEQFVVIFDDLSRFARDLKVHIQLKTELISRGANLECLNFKFDESEEGELIEMVMAATNQYNRKSNRRQVIQKMKARMENGYWPLCMPLGLINKKHPVHGKILVRREPYATIYKEGIEKFRDGLLQSVLEFREFVNEKYEENGIAHRMSFETARETLRQILYAGYIDYQKWGIPRMKAKHDGFISIETFEAVQQRLQGRTKIWRRRDYSSDFPLRPLVLCAVCKTPMTGSYHKSGTGKKTPHYYCRKSKRECSNGNRNVPKKLFEQQFEALLATVRPPEELIELAKAVLIETWETRKENQSTLQSKLKNGKEEIDNKIKNYMDRISKTTDQTMILLYEEEIKKLYEEKKGIESRLIANPYTEVSFGTAADKVFNVIKNPVAMWQSEDYNDKRTIVSMYFDEKLRYDYYLGFGTTSLAYPISLIAQNSVKETASVEMGGNEPPSKNHI